MSEELIPTPEVIAKRRHPAALCEICPFGADKNYVPTFNLVPSGKLAIIGAAPGVHEARKGIPFTGPSGELTDQILQHHGIRREDVMLTNVVSCKPEGQDSDPPKAAIDACRPRLVEEIKESGVELIVSLGKVAMGETINDRGSMRKIRVGPPKPYKYDPSIGVIATWHTAYALRSPDSFPDIVFDFGKIRGKVENDWTEPDYRVFDNPVSAARALEELRLRFDRVVIDIETGVEKDNSFDHPSEYDLLCVGIAFAKGKAVVIGETALRDDVVRARLRDLLSSTKIIAHNGKFDLAGLRNVCGRQTLWFDTMLASNTLDERPGHHGLKQLSVERLGAPEYEADIHLYVPKGGNYANIPRDVLYKYNAYDVVCTWDLYEMFSLEFSEADWQKHNFIVEAANALIELELNGIHFDVEYNEKLSHEYLTILNDIEAKMDELVGYKVNPRSPKQLTDYYATHYLQLPSTNADLLKELRDQLDGEVLAFTDLLLEHRKKAKLYGTYVKGLAKRVTAEGKVYTTYTLHGTTSGRLASRQPNLQNITREKSIRNQFVVEDHASEEPENRLIQCDYKQVEGRVITTLARDEYLRNIFADSARDLFSELCNDIFGVGMWEKEQRVAMKSIFYGCVPLYTKILTKRGWLTYDQVIPNVDETIGYDPILKRSRWTKITEVLTYKDADLVQLSNSTTTFEVTPNHRWFSSLATRPWNGPTKKHLPRTYQEEFVETAKIKKEHLIHLSKRFQSDSKLDITEQEASILGWVMSDGTMKISKATGITSQGRNNQRQAVIMKICQDVKNVQCVQEIEGILKGYEHTKYKQEGNDQIWWSIPAVAARDLLKRAGLLVKSGNYEDVDPLQFAFSMSDEQRVAFIRAVYLGDGTKGKNIISQNEGWMTEVIRIIGYLGGYVVRSSNNNFSKWSDKNHYKHIFRKGYITGQKLTTKPIGRADVWCVRTDLGTWTMEQDGLVVLTGNSAYGRGHKSIAKELQLQGLSITEAEAALFMREFNALIPGVTDWQKSIKQHVLAGNDLTTPFGRKRSFWLITDKNKSDVLNEALSYLPQSIASDICLRALIRLTPMLEGLATPRLSIHDAIVVETHKDKVDETIALMRREMVKSATEFSTYLPFEVDATVGTKWGSL